MNFRLSAVLSVLAVAPLSIAAADPAPAAPFELMKPSYPTLVFRDGAVPATFAAQEGGRLEITDKMFRSESGHALRFSWDKPGAAFSWKTPGAFRDVNGANPDPSVYQWCVVTMLSAFEVWVFNEKQVDDRVWFEVGTATRTDARFHLNLNFSGWRRLSAIYGRDIRAIPRPDADTLRVFAPKTPAGSLVFDMIDPRCERDPRFVRRTAEAPWVNNPAAARAGGGLCTDPVVANLASVSRRPVDLGAPATLDASQARALAALTAKYLKRFDAPVTPRELTPGELASLRATYASHRVVRTGALVSGQTGSARKLWSDIGALATARRQAAGDPALSAEFAGMAADLVDLAIQLGFGANYGADDGFVRPALLLRDDLVASGRWQPLLARLREIYLLDELDDAGVYGNADAFNTWLHGQLGVILLGEDGPAKWRDMLAFRRYLDFTADHGEIKGDGSAFHHDMTYAGYGNPAVESIGDTLFILKGSPFFPARCHEILRRTAWATRFYSCEKDMPHYLGGRWRGAYSISPKLFRDLAECGAPGSGEPLDRTMASIYLGYGFSDEDSARYTAAGLRPLIPTGNLTLPYSVSSFQRRDHWMLAVHGQKRQFRSAEAYGFQKGNTMGRYISFGQTFIHSKRLSPGEPVTAHANGLIFDKGWDYSRWPGTTARVLPNEALRSHFEVEEMTTSEPYAGGVSLDGDGLFAMKLREDIPGDTDPLRLGPTRWWLGEAEFARRIKDSCYDTSFRARKSWFFFEDCTVCLGSGITCRDDRFPINTTLFQNSLALPGRREHFVAGDLQGDVFPLDRKISGKPAWMLDSADTGYFVPAGNPPLHLLRAERALPYKPYWVADVVKWATSATMLANNRTLAEKVEPNAGEMELAWFDHGAAPAAPSGYEYALLVDTDAAAMKRFAATPRYRVLRKDDAAHVVDDTPTRSVGYALFEPVTDLTVPGADAFAPALRSVSKPCLIMLRANGSRAYRMAFADPDPNLKPLHGEDGTVIEWGHDGLAAPPTVTRVALAGLWRVHSPAVKSVSHTAGTTVLDIACVESSPVNFDLEPAGVE